MGICWAEVVSSATKTTGMDHNAPTQQSRCSGLDCGASLGRPCGEFNFQISRPREQFWPPRVLKEYLYGLYMMYITYCKVRTEPKVHTVLSQQYIPVRQPSVPLGAQNCSAVVI